MRKKIVIRRLIVILAAVATTALAAVGLATVGNDFRFTQVGVQIPLESGHLDGVLTLPIDRESRGLVVVVHGDAAVNATQDGLYSPWFEGAADAGYATLSWSKPGVGASTGNWLDQSMDDRASEVNTAIDWALAQSDMPTQRIVLWGASQAGWVMPQVIASRDDIDGVVAVGTAVNWLSQGRFNLLAELDHDGASHAERERAIAESDAVRDLLADDDGYEKYLLITTDTEPMTAERWEFVARNMRTDATADLLQAASRQIPVLLLVGTHDRNVDVAETERVYRELFGEFLSVAHVDGAHSLARPAVDEHAATGVITGIFWPRALLAPGALESYREFLSEIL